VQVRATQGQVDAGGIGVILPAVNAVWYIKQKQAALYLYVLVAAWRLAQMKTLFRRQMEVLIACPVQATGSPGCGSSRLAFARIVESCILVLWIGSLSFGSFLCYISSFWLQPNPLQLVR